MGDSYDKRRTLGEWVRDHPAEAARFTPDQVEQILSVVSFSLDQPAVAGEIAAGMEASNSLTCAHVVAAMRVCRYQSSDVAKTMVPFVKDPQNKQAVLEQVEFTYERDAVEKCFRRAGGS